MEKVITLTEKDFLAATTTAAAKYLDELQEVAKKKGHDVNLKMLLSETLSCAAFFGILSQILFPKETEAEKEAEPDKLVPANTEAQ